jgi:hypothetical protein
VEEFRDKLQGEHGDNVHAVEYRAALVLVEAHYTAWPATVVEEDAPAESLPNLVPNTGNCPGLATC